MTVQIRAARCALDRIRLIAITQRGRFGNGAPPAFFQASMIPFFFGTECWLVVERFLA